MRAEAISMLSLIHILDGNPDEQEREIRERLKLVQPDEKVFITGDPAKQ